MGGFERKYSWKNKVGQGWKRWKLRLLHANDTVIMEVEMESILRELKEIYKEHTAYHPPSFHFQHIHLRSFVFKA